MRLRLLNETTPEYIKDCRAKMLAQREFVQSLKEIFQNHRDRNGCRELGRRSCTGCDLFLENIYTNEQILDEYNERYRKAVNGHEV